jgi:hypothetical protein
MDGDVVFHAIGIVNAIGIGIAEFQDEGGDAFFGRRG